MCQGAATGARPCAGLWCAAERVLTFGSPAAPRRAPNPGLREGWAEKILSVLVIFPGNLSFRTYTCAYLVGGATTEPVSSRLILGLGFRELPSPPSNGGGLFELRVWGKVPPSQTLSN